MKRKLDHVGNNDAEAENESSDLSDNCHQTTNKRQRDQALLNIESASLVGSETRNSAKTGAVGKKTTTIRNALLGAYSAVRKKPLANKQQQGLSSQDVNDENGNELFSDNQFHINDLHELPLDWSLGSSIRFVSDRSFLWVSHLTDLAKTVGMRQLISRRSIDLSTSSALQPSGCSQSGMPDDASGSSSTMGMNLSLSVCADLYRSMLYFQFPASQLPQSVKEKMRLLSFSTVKVMSGAYGSQQQKNDTNVGVGGVTSLVKKEVQDDSSSNATRFYSVSAGDQADSNDRLMEPAEAEQHFSIQGYQIFKDVLGGDATFLNERMHDWCISLSSVYTLFNNGECPYFYMLRENQMSVMFICANVGGSISVRAILTSSTPDKTHQKLNDSSIEFQRKVDSSFLFIGRRRVHALYGFLLMDCVKHISSDFPTIIAPVTFMNAALKSLRITKNESFSKVSRSVKTTKNLNSAQEDKPHYILELSGYMLPHAKHALTNAMTSAVLSSDDSNSVLAINLHNEKLTTSFNIQNTEEENTMSSQQPSTPTVGASPNIGRCTWNYSPQEPSDLTNELRADIFACLKSDDMPTFMNKSHISKITVRKSTANQLVYDIMLAKNE